MIKKILLIVFCILISNTMVFAGTDDKFISSDSSVNRSSELLKKIKCYRTTVYDSLELTEEQAKQIGVLDKKLYSDIEPKLKEMYFSVTKIEDIAKSENCTKKAVNNIKKEFKAVENDMNSIKNDYDKKFIQVLNSQQKSKYRLIRKQKQAELKKEIEKHKALQKSNNNQTQEN